MLLFDLVFKRLTLVAFSVFLLSIANISFGDDHSHEEAEHDHDHDEHNEEHHDMDEHDQNTNLMAHTHGVSTLNLVAEDNHLLVEFLSPMANLSGFEHEPTSDEEKEIYRQTFELLESPANILSLSSDAECQLSDVFIEQTMQEKMAKHENHENEHSENEHSEDEHSDAKIVYDFACQDLNKLSSIDFTGFKTFQGIETLNINIILQNRQEIIQLNKNDSSIFEL